MNAQQKNGNANQPQPHPWKPLVIKSAGACCAVGYHLAAASCALRAGMDHFQESEFIDQAGEPLRVARLPLGDLWGPKRLAQIVNMAVADCAELIDGIDPATTAFFLLAAERGRPHTETERYQEAYRACEEQFKTRFHAASAILPLGRAGIGDALLHAQKVLQETQATPLNQVLLVGADSFLNAATIQHYLSQKRLLATGNSNGFIPGEGAGALLLALATDQSTGLHIMGLGMEKEEATFDGDIPNRAIGLTRAIRQSCEQASVEPNELAFRMTDQNGEQYFSKEGANACTRIMAEDSAFLPVRQIADCVGETGAAAGPMMLAYLSTVMPLEEGPGFTGLLHLANDDGKRTALVVEQYV